MIEQRSQRTLGVNSFSLASMTRTDSCTVKSIGAKGKLETPVRFWWIQKVALDPEKLTDLI